MNKLSEDFKVIIGNRLKTLRKKRKSRITDVIDVLDIGRSTYTDWEAGRRSPNGEKLVMLAKFYSTTVDYITGKTDDDSAISSDDLKEILNNSTLVYEGKEITREQSVAINSILESYFKNLNKH